MYTIHDYNEQVATCKSELDTLRDIVDEFINRWSTIRESIDDTIDELDNVPEED